MSYALIGVLVLVVAGVIRVWTKRRLTREQWDKIGARVEIAFFLGLMALGVGVTFYYHFAG
jgi:hypothetical protein